jgi:hypothetical protein
MTSIYRFEKLDWFEQAIRDKELTFVSPYKWPDRNEGLLFRHVFSHDKMEKVRATAHEMFKDSFPDQDIGNDIAGLLTALRMTRLAQCWSRCHGNNVLWQDKDVRIEVSREDISRLNRVKAYDVDYVESVTVEDGLKRLNLEHVAGGGTRVDIDSVLLVKQNSFSPEDEVRLLVVEGENTNRDRTENLLFTQIFAQFRRQGKMSKEDFESHIARLMIMDKKKVSFAHVENFIRSVTLADSASPEVEMRVERFCEEHSLDYLGRWQPKPC